MHYLTSIEYGGFKYWFNETDGKFRIDASIYCQEQSSKVYVPLQIMNFGDWFMLQSRLHVKLSHNSHVSKAIFTKRSGR